MPACHEARAEYATLVSISMIEVLIEGDCFVDADYSRTDDRRKGLAAKGQ